MASTLPTFVLPAVPTPVPAVIPATGVGVSPPVVATASIAASLTASGAPASLAGVSVLPSSIELEVPEKVCAKILKLEFVEMYELLPESWQFDGVVSSSCQQQAQAHRASRKSPVTDIALWCECYGTLVAVLATRYAQYTPELMAYERTVVRAARNFEGTAWATYDVLPQESCPPQGSGLVKGRP